MGFAALARLRAPAAAALPRNAVLKPAAKRQAAGARSLARSLIHSLLPISTALTRFPPCSVPPPPPFQLNISNPSTGCQICIEIEDERQLRTLRPARPPRSTAPTSATSTRATSSDLRRQRQAGLPDEAGRHHQRPRAIAAQGRGPLLPSAQVRRAQAQVRPGCIVGPDLSVLNLVQVKGDAEVPGLTDTAVPRRLGPKRASKIRALFNLDKEDDVRPDRRGPSRRTGKEVKKSPKIQRLITPIMLQRKRAERRRAAIEKAKSARRPSTRRSRRRIQEQKKARRSPSPSAGRRASRRRTTATKQQGRHAGECE